MRTAQESGLTVVSYIVPLDIVGIIIDLLATEGDTDSLKATSLAYLSFLHLSRNLLFYSNQQGSLERHRISGLYGFSPRPQTSHNISETSTIT